MILLSTAAICVQPAVAAAASLKEANPTATGATSAAAATTQLVAASTAAATASATLVEQP